MLVRTLALVLATAALMVPTSAPATATPDNFTPRGGATFNSPVGDRSSQRQIFRRIIRSINSSPRGSTIRIFSWNFLTREGKEALLRAQRRGVKVQVLMDNKNNVQIENQPFRRLRAGLHKGNRDAKRGRKSWARTCQHACRAKGGSAHAKFFLFSKAGRARRVVMHGSANLTVASTRNQWNDLYTHTGNRKVWRFMNVIFKQASRDKNLPHPFAARTFKRYRLMMFPVRGKGVADPVMKMLDRTRCRGARNTPSGRTRIRIAPDVIRHQRGMRLARRLREMWENGCSIKIGYTVIGIDIGKMLRSKRGRGPVPMKHLAQDFNGDGQFDNYFHLKAMTIVGRYGGDRSAHALLNGSANWSGLGAASDENVGIYRSRGPVHRYEKHINYWYHHFPRDGSGRHATSARARRGEPALIFGHDENAVYEDGTPVGHDPFASMETD